MCDCGSRYDSPRLKSHVSEKDYLKRTVPRSTCPIMSLKVSLIELDRVKFIMKHNQRYDKIKTFLVLAMRSTETTTVQAFKRVSWLMEQCRFYSLTTVGELVTWILKFWNMDDMAGFTMHQLQAILYLGMTYIYVSQEVNQEKRISDVAVPMVDVYMVANHSKWGNNLWLGDTGASCQMTYDKKGMFDCRTIKSMFKLGDGKSLVATKIGKKRMIVHQQDGSKT
jgi:hypothetical protein